MMFKQSIVFVLVILIGFHCWAITSVTIGDSESCPTQEVLVPVDATDLLDVAAITMFIGYNSENAEFVTLENIHPSLAGGIVFNGMTLPSVQIGISWSSVNPVNIPSGKLFDIRFLYFGGDCPLPFNPGYEFVRSDLSIITDVQLNPGSLFPSIFIISQPVSVRVTEGSSADFDITTNDNVNYHWLVNEGDGWLYLSENEVYTGVQSHHLKIFDVPLSLDSAWYRCELTHNGCVLTSDSAQLFVDSSTMIISESISAGVDVSSSPLSQSIKVFITDINIQSLEFGLIDFYGRTVFKKLIQLPNAATFNYFEFEIPPGSKGVYLVSLNVFYQKVNKIFNKKIVF